MSSVSGRMRSTSSQQPSWRPILPRYGERPPPPPPKQAYDLLPRSRSVVPIACENCRKGRVKCSGGRPTCRTCASENKPCIYRAEAGESGLASLRRQNVEIQRELQRLRRSHKSLHQIVSALQTRGDSEVSTIVRHLRDAQDPEVTARQLEGGDLLLQLRVSPETRFRFTFPYRRDMPAALLTPDNVYLQSPLFESECTWPNPGTAVHPVVETQRPQYFKPYAAAQIADSRLSRVDLSHWTSVCTDDTLMRKLLHDYLLWDHQVFPSFHKDYFLDGLLSRDTRFCSSLLVNAILAYACTCHQGFPNRAEYWNPQSLGYRFFAETRRLWDMERDEPSSITTIQAGMIINYTYNTYSMDKVGLSYSAQAAAMAHDIGLFRAADGSLDSRLQVVRDYTAWSLYHCLSFQCYYFMIPCPLQEEPAAPLPDPGMDPAWYGEFLLQYPSGRTTVAMHHPQWTRFKFTLGSILRPVARELFDKEERSDQESCRQLYSRAFVAMQELYSALPAQLSPAQIVFPLHMGVHLWYHDAMMSICRLLLPDVDGDMAPSESCRSIRAQLSHSRICFETILRLYYLRNGYENGDFVLMHYLAVLAFMALGDLPPSTLPASSLESQDDTRGTLLLAAKGLREQGRNYFMSAGISLVLQGQMAPGDLNILAHHCGTSREDDTVQAARAEHVKAIYPLNIVKRTDDPETQRLRNMIKQYDKHAAQEAQ